MLAAIGVVFGDIGTSPLYAIKECFNPHHGIAVTPAAVLGVLSMLFWAIVIVVALKYILFVMSANNKGEGGVLALMALALRTTRINSRRALLYIMLGMLGACMFYGDAVITPAISVLSAVEGLEVALPGTASYVLPITLVILIALFFIQRSGTAWVGKLFGPIMLIWFAVLGVIGVMNILEAPEILVAINPMYAYAFIHEHAVQSFIVLGSVFLVLTGAEALYADMGHFGASPIRRAWFFLVMPTLVLNYFGQGALILLHPSTIAHPFYHMVPEAFRLPMVLLATLATVIASQAVISGAFSLTSQAILLGFVPRMRIHHTSESAIGQVYIPVVNWMLLALVVFVVIGFKKSEHLAAAYGIAVTTTMVITTLLAGVVMRSLWKWHPALVALVSFGFLAVDVAFFCANLIKIREGGWFPLLLGGVTFLLLATWYSGQKLLRQRTHEQGTPLKPFLHSLLAHPPHRVEGTAVFLTGNVRHVPIAMLHNLKHNRVLHKRVIFLKFSIWDVPYVDDVGRLTTKQVGENIYLLRAAFGFKETPDVQRVLKLAKQQLMMPFDLMDTSFFLSRDTPIPTQRVGWFRWRQYLFAWMYQNAARPSDFFQIPSNRVVELGAKVEI
ncbi:MAG: potassium transporter Kup [Ottowia sp.]|nr:potassium transporter Kup [Ottowia sp.]